MERLPVEVIGNILSCLKSARYAVVASTTCKKWRWAFQYHLNSLTFSDGDFWLFCLPDITNNRLPRIITQTVRQTKGLQCLSFFLSDVDDRFKADHVLAWLMHARDTLCELYLHVRISPTINILEICPWQKLEVLELAHVCISGGESSYPKFPCLKTLRLEDISVSALDLCFLLFLCPKIENLTLVDLDVQPLDADLEAILALTNDSLKTIDVVRTDLDKFILEAHNLEHLYLRRCNLELELVGKGILKVLSIDNAEISYFNIGDNMENLEVVDINGSEIKGPKLYHMISRSSNLRRLRLWNVKFDNVDEVIDLEYISTSFPQLTHLSLCYNVKDTQFIFQGSSHLQNVVVLELGCAGYYGFTDWIPGVMERCPNLQKMVFYGFVCKETISEDLKLLAEFSSAILEMVRKYPQAEFQFKYKGRFLILEINRNWDFSLSQALIRHMYVEE